MSPTTPCTSSQAAMFRTPVSSNCSPPYALPVARPHPLLFSLTALHQRARQRLLLHTMTDGRVRRIYRRPGHGPRVCPPLPVCPAHRRCPPRQHQHRHMCTRHLQHLVSPSVHARLHRHLISLSSVNPSSSSRTQRLGRYQHSAPYLLTSFPTHQKLGEMRDSDKQKAKEGKMTEASRTNNKHCATHEQKV